MRTMLLAAAAAVVAMAACGRGADADSFVGVWEGTKTYLGQGGEPVGSAPGWTFEIVQDGLTSLRFVNGPAVVVTRPTEFTVGEIDYPPRASPGPLNHCAPTAQSITGGTGRLEANGVLHVDLFWNETCGGVTTARQAVFTMTRAQPPGDGAGSLL
jgi:hypothetical protein